MISWKSADLRRRQTQSKHAPTFKSLATIAACFVVTGGWLVFHEFSGSKWAVYAAVLIGGTQLVFFAMKPGIKQLEAKTG